MATKTLRRAQLPCCLASSTSTTSAAQQTRHASLLRRPIRPYTFTQLVTLSDGSTYLSRTTSPVPIFRSTKDTRNSPLWQPSLSALRNQEQDEAGRLRAFRERFGRGWDLDAVAEEETGEEGEKGMEAKAKRSEEEVHDSLMDLISGGYVGDVKGQAARAVMEVTEEEVKMSVKRDGVMNKFPVQEGKAPKGQKGA